MFYVTGTSGDSPSNYTLTGVTRLKGYAGNLAEGTTINCLNHEEYFNQWGTSIATIEEQLDGTDTDGIFPADVHLPTGGQIDVNEVNPKRTMSIPASAMFGATTSGAAGGQYESSTNKVNVRVLDFDTSSDEYACFNVPAPNYWDLSTITAQFHWTSAGGTPAQTVTWAIQALARSNDDALDTAYGTAVTVADTLIATNDEHISSATSAITVGGTPAKGDMLYFRIYRDVSEDDMSGDARLLGVRITFSISQFSDE